MAFWSGKKKKQQEEEELRKDAEKTFGKIRKQKLALQKKKQEQENMLKQQLEW